jgi:hypothetical protein
MAKFGVDPHGRWNHELASQQFDDHVQNIVSRYRSASPEFLKGGSEWYERAHDEAKKVGKGNVERGAGLIAALSPQMSWDRNVSMAHELVKTGQASHTDDNLQKAIRIQDGAHPLEVLGGHKVRSFYHNIVDPSNPDPVTIDRHAHDIAVGNPFKGSGGGSRAKSPDLGLGAMGRYKHFENAYKTASGHLDVGIPNRVQAVTWVAHRGAIG